MPFCNFGAVAVMCNARAPHRQQTIMRAQIMSRRSLSSHPAPKCVLRAGVACRQIRDMRLFVFISDKGGGVIGLTTRPDGGNLPPSFLPWTKVDDDPWSLDETEAPKLTEAVARDGCYVMASGHLAPRPPVTVEVRRRPVRVEVRRSR